MVQAYSVSYLIKSMRSVFQHFGEGCIDNHIELNLLLQFVLRLVILLLFDLGSIGSQMQVHVPVLYTPTSFGLPRRIL